eukprot:SAG31_NODE_7741_length_1605_cov_1.891102_1_plen_69_part_10
MFVEPITVTGQLLGLDSNDALEVTSCFPFPHETDDDDRDGTKYQTEMMVPLRGLNDASTTDVPDPHSFH